MYSQGERGLGQSDGASPLHVSLRWSMNLKSAMTINMVQTMANMSWRRWRE